MFPIENRFRDRKERIVTAVTETNGHNVMDSPYWLSGVCFCCAAAVLPFINISDSRADEIDGSAKGVKAVAAPMVIEEQLDQALQQRRGTVTSGMSIRQAVKRLQHDTGVSIVIDRRVNPSSLLSLSTGYVTVRETIDALAAARRAKVSYGKIFVVIAPPSAAARHRTLNAINEDTVLQLRNGLERDIYAALVDRREYSWSQLSEPRRLLVDAATAAGLTVTNADAIPHDLWSASSLPELTFADFATVVLNQFDLTFQLSADAKMTIVAVPNNLRIEQRHRISMRQKDDIVSRWMKAFPDLQIDWKGTAAVVNATVEVHDQLEQLIHGELPETVEAAGLLSRRFTVTLPAGTKLGQVMATLETQKITVRFVGIDDDALQGILNREVSVAANKLSAEDFFRLVFQGLDARVRVTDTDVAVDFSNE